MKPGDIDVMINGAIHEFIEKLERDENGIDEFHTELAKIINGALIDMFEKSVTSFHDEFTEDQVTNIRFKLIRAWSEYSETMFKRNNDNYHRKDN